MKKVLTLLQKKCNLVTLANAFAFALMVSSVNSTCYWIHHQPEVPAEAKQYRKF